ncbi:twin transmembrane helix small protein [Leucothrix arctica]|uniref:Twin transmembrane helix small protein n=1 Tax=Leucothrix arctica TaxID=1481894 RepID=A0A317CKD8_9GAMM|nr:twin transmembrane helix small protein [Leucothrix arctica]
MKVVVLCFFVFILYSLGSAGYYMMKDPSGSRRMLKALTMRIGASILLFMFLMFSYWMGWIQPDGAL